MVSFEQVVAEFRMGCANRQAAIGAPEVVVDPFDQGPLPTVAELVEEIQAWNERHEAKARLRILSGSVYELEWWAPFLHDGKEIGLAGFPMENGGFYYYTDARLGGDKLWAPPGTFPGAVYKLTGQPLVRSVVAQMHQPERNEWLSHNFRQSCVPAKPADQLAGLEVRIRCPATEACRSARGTAAILSAHILEGYFGPVVCGRKTDWTPDNFLVLHLTGTPQQLLDFRLRLITAYPLIDVTFIHTPAA